MKKLIKVISIIFISVFIVSGCGYHRHLRHHYPSKTHMQTQTYTQNVRDINRQGYSHSMTPAHSMSELDNQSRSVRPTMVYSYPANAKIGNATVVDLRPIRYKVLNYLNSVRANGSVCSSSAPPVTFNAELEQAALAHSKDMAVNNFLGHLGSGKMTDTAKKAPGRGSNFYERILYSGYPIKPGSLAGEILTYTKFRIVGSKDPYKNFVHAVNNFLKSSRHCQILMNPRFKDVGIAAYRDNEKIYWTIEFGEVKY